jgi:hypothetical protein
MASRKNRESCSNAPPLPRRIGSHIGGSRGRRRRAGVVVVVVTIVQEPR